MPVTEALMPGVATGAAVGEDEVPIPRLVLPLDGAEPGSEVPLPSEESRWVPEAMTLDLSSQEQRRMVQLAIGGTASTNYS